MFGRDRSIEYAVQIMAALSTPVYDHDKGEQTIMDPAMAAEEAVNRVRILEEELKRREML